jgi:hypothetical protein
MYVIGYIHAPAALHGEKNHTTSFNRGLDGTHSWSGQFGKEKLLSLLGLQLAGWLVGWWVSWLVGWLGGYSWWVFGWFIGWLVGWLVGWVGGWSVGR